MNTRIQGLVDLFFNDLPYSEEMQAAKTKILAALEKEFKRLSEEKTEEDAFETLLAEYGTLTKMAALAGYTEKDAQKWRLPGEVKHKKRIKKEITHQKRKIYLLSLLWISTGVYFLRIFLVGNAMPLLFALPCGVLAFFLSRNYRRKELLLSNEQKYDADAYQYLRKLSDQYAKRTLNGIALLASATVIFCLLEFQFYFSGNSKLSEVLQNIITSGLFLEIPVYLCVKNILCLRMLRRRIGLPKKGPFRKHLLFFSVGVSVYWGIVLVSVILLFLFGGSSRYPVNTVFCALGVFLLLLLLYNLIFRAKILYQNVRFNLRRVAAFTVAALLFTLYSAMQRDYWYMQPYINRTPVVTRNESRISYNEQNGVYTITSSEKDFKILHLTDIHLGGSLYSYSKDIKALQAVYDEIAYTKPDLVVITGDLVFPLGIMSLSLNNSSPVNQFAAFMRNIDVPWVFTYGNHDTESLANFSKQDMNELFMQLSYKTSGNLLYPYTQPSISGRNNQLVEIRNEDGSLRQALFLIDSNAYIDGAVNVYDYIHDDQVEWYAKEVKRLNREEGHVVPSMAFFHIPLQEYRTAYELYEQGSDEVTYFFGENGETMINKVCCSDYPSKLFDTVLALGSTKALFCGHDHYNNLSLEYKGVRLTYGMSIDYLAMPGIENDTKQRGAELITVYRDGGFDIRQIPLSSIQS